LDPSVALIWSSEPDKTQHEDGVGLGRAPAALGEADAEFGELLEYLESSGRAENTNVIVLSDHAYSTISEVVPVEAQLRDAGFPDISQPGGVAVAGNGGSVLFYVHNGDSRTSRQLTGWLETKPWCGAVFASRRMGEIEGTFPAALIGCDGPRSPDIAMSFLWNSESNAAGYPGYAPSTGGKVGQGQHGSASQHELRNVGLARGPSFRTAATVETPTGNVDVTPTILHLLGIEHGETPMDGRILFEALGSGTGELPAPTTEILRAGVGQFQQAIQLSRIGESIYIDWANRV
jgi:arylsulfatase A-like enzyme